MNDFKKAIECIDFNHIVKNLSESVVEQIDSIIMTDLSRKQNRIWKMRNDKNWWVRREVANRLKDQNRIWEMRTDENWWERREVVKKLEGDYKLAHLLLEQ
jgi:hypothetical protein